MERTDFAQHLQENSARLAGGEALFSPGIYDPVGRKTWMESKSNEPVSDGEISEAESQLECTLPSGYKTFLKILGPGVWAEQATLRSG